MPEKSAGLSSSQRGTIAEYFVATALMAASGGRLSPFVPLVDDHGVDLVVLDKPTGRSLAVQVKSWVGGDPARGTVQFDVRKATFREAGGGALIAVVLDPAGPSMQAAWLFPMAEVPAVAVERADKYALSPGRSPDSRDRYAAYRHADAASLARAVVSMLSG